MALHPGKAEANPQYAGCLKDSKHKWMKLTRLDNKLRQIGSPVPVLIGSAQGHKLTQKWLGEAARRPHPRIIRKLIPAIPTRFARATFNLKGKAISVS